MKNGKLMIATIADIHIGKENPDDLRKELMEGFLSYVETEGPNLDMVVIAGDYFDRIIRFNEPSGLLALEVMDVLLNAALEHNFLLRVVQGTKSHENNQLQVFDGYEESYPHILKIIRKVMKESIKLGDREEPYKVLYLPEEYPTDPDSYYEDFFSDTYDFIYGHGMTDSVGFSFSDWKDESENIQLGTPVHKTDQLLSLSRGPIIFGHIHNKKEYKGKFYYTGSYGRYAFDSQEPKGFLVTTVNPLDTSDYQVEFHENKLAKTYGIIAVDNLPLQEGEDLLDVLNLMAQQYDHAKIVSADPTTLKLMRQLTESSTDIKIQTAKKLQSEVVDEKFNFILENKLSTEETVHKYLEIVEPDSMDAVPLEAIRMVIDPNKDYFPEDVVTALQEQKA